MADSYLFTVRLWREETGDGCTEWGGRVQYVYSNQTNDFGDWQELISYLVTSVARYESCRAAGARAEGASGK